ncbi:uncharacterized protein CIMG_00611 [Coccidioides immitis RS]|uniref:Uncharacterized protein n=1 Tax=Coccidioides immitis (strain RS) TaxID=246410 RepID=J3KHC8_COCIM|nr:uncharacterized protein CIMG_00611 [Coccidioides immitis RS]EAS35257.3 hypothetical protein CIMG_00611 [Coccidioides immitis RS]TPX26465.1 hypothetical protein DIZ76_011927 [Coccidioides immitis]
MALGSTTPPVNTENANQGMQAIDTQTVLMNGNHVQLLDVVSIFKGKLHAAADRHKVSDVADLEHLINLYGQSLRPHAGKFSLRDVSKVAQGIQSDEGTWISPPSYNAQIGIIEQPKPGVRFLLFT